MAQVRRTAFFLFSSLPLIGAASAQTNSTNGQAGAANLSNISPAWQVMASAPAGSPEALQLTDAVLANRTVMSLADASLFAFGSTNGTIPARTCKPLPGDAAWPNASAWDTLKVLTGGAVAETVPIGAVCYEGAHYDAAQCQTLLDTWSDADLHANHPTSIMWPLFQGGTCLPQNAASGGTCELGGFPPYTVNVSNVAQVQLAVNFARNTGVRLIVKNTGHDYLGKSVGKGALSIWTHNLKGIDFIQNYSSPSTNYTSSALKLGAGVQGIELFKAADKYGVTGLSGEGRTVGVAGGFTAGGGHSPLTNKLGMGVDQVLSLDVVTPDGRFVTADQVNNQDLFWALRGGGGSTFGVVTSMTVKAHPKMTISGMNFTVTSGTNGTISNDLFWSAMSTYMRLFPGFADQGSYAYSTVFPAGEDGYLWTMLPWLVPGMRLDDFKAMAEPLLTEWEGLGFNVTPTFFEYDNFLSTYLNHFGADLVANPTVRTASRLFPRENWENPGLLNDTVDFLREIVTEGSSLILYNTGGKKPDDAPDSAVAPAWREAYMFAIVGTVWSATAPESDIEAINRKITNDWTARLKSLTPGGGTYLNEADVMEPDFQSSFYGYDNYLRLSAIKKAYDPWGLFWTPTGILSDEWYITNQTDWLTLQTGQLCPK